MINILLLILIINQIFHIVVKPHISTLNCGIWGFFGNINKFDLSKFNILGINNEDRGGDAIGIASQESIIHNINHTKYTDFIATNKLKHPSKKINYVAGHVRKASEYTTRKFEEYAQPMLNWNDDFTEINHIFSHNGTLLEYNKLFDLHLKDIGVSKFSYLNINTGDISINTINDSHVLFQSLIHKKYEVLRDYAGTAAFVYYDTKTKELYLYAGKSKNMHNSFVSNERPLYYLQGKDYIWYSSIESGLKIIGNKDDIFSVTPNTVMIFKDGLLINTIAIDRSNSGQSVYKTKALKPVYNPEGFVKNLYKNYSGSESKNDVPLNRSLVILPHKTNIFKEVLTGSTLCVEFVNSRYYHAGRLINGIYHLTETGLVKPTANYTSSYNKAITDVYYFVDGIMLLDHTSYNEVCRLIKKHNHKQGRVGYFKLLCQHSVYPIANIFSDNVDCQKVFYHHIKNENVDGEFRYTGSMYPLFSNTAYFFVSGILNGTSVLPNERHANHSFNHEKPKPIGRFCKECGLMLGELEDHLCDFCAEVKFQEIKETINKGSENTAPWYEEDDNDENEETTDVNELIDLTKTNNLSEDDIKSELNSIDVAISELKYRLLGEDDPFLKKTKEVCEEIQDALTELTNWSWENNIS